MAIYGQEQINVSNVENQSANSDTLFTAFHKVQNNFTRLFSATSPFNTFYAGNGLSANVDTANNVVTFTNTGVTSIVAGSGVAVANANGQFTISSTANGNVGVTNVAVTSSSLNVSGSPIISHGTIGIELPTIPVSASFNVGSYVAPNVTVDRFGRIIAISNSPGVGTVTSVTVQGGPGIGVNSGTVTSSGVITVNNTGVTSLTAGTGIQLTGSNGDITITSLPGSATVSRVNVTSNSLVVTGSPITSSGTITVDLPQDFTLTGNITLDDLSTYANISVGNAFSVSGNAIIGHNLITEGEFTLLGNMTSVGNIFGRNANLGNLASANYIQGNGSLLTSITGANVTGWVANANVSNTATKAGTVTTAAQPNITSLGTVVNLTVSANTNVNNLIVANTGDLFFNSVNDNTKGVVLQAPTAIAGSSGTYIAWSLPNTMGTASQYLTTDGAGTMKWATVANSGAPATASSAGTQGQIAFDSTHIYVCIATNTWIRAAAAAW